MELYFSFLQCCDTVSWVTPPRPIINKMQNGDILVPANPGPPGKMAVKIERVLEGFLSGDLRMPGLMLSAVE